MSIGLTHLKLRTEISFVIVTVGSRVHNNTGFESEKT